MRDKKLFWKEVKYILIGCVIAILYSLLILLILSLTPCEYTHDKPDYHYRLESVILSTAPCEIPEKIMGHVVKPYDDDYLEGAACAACNDVLFHGRTPRFVKALFKGLEVYPGEDPPPARPRLLLEQDAVNACHWVASFWDNGNIWVAAWQINDPDPEWNSRLTLEVNGVPLFWGKSDSLCGTSFENEYNGELGFWTFGGSGSVRWGLKVDEGY